MSATHVPEELTRLVPTWRTRRANDLWEEGNNAGAGAGYDQEEVAGMVRVGVNDATSHDEVVVYWDGEDLVLIAESYGGFWGVPCTLAEFLDEASTADE